MVTMPQHSFMIDLLRKDNDVLSKAKRPIILLLKQVASNAKHNGVSNVELTIANNAKLNAELNVISSIELNVASNVELNVSNVELNVSNEIPISPSVDIMYVKAE